MVSNNSNKYKGVVACVPAVAETKSIIDGVISECICRAQSRRVIVGALKSPLPLPSKFCYKNENATQATQNSSVVGSGAGPATQSCRGKTDPAWEHCTLNTDNEGKKSIRCLHCGKSFRGGGINRVKQHLAGKKGDVAKCLKVPHDVSFRMSESLMQSEEKRSKNVDNYCSMHPYGPDFIEDMNDFEVSQPMQSSQLQDKGKHPMSTSQRKRKADGINNYFAPRTEPGAQPSIKSVLAGKEAILKADLAVAKFFYDTCIPLNTSNSRYYQVMADAIAAIGPGYKMPNYHALRNKLLALCKKEVQLSVDQFRASWEDTGCTIMTDGWQDQSNRQLINFLVYSPRGLTFVKSVDASDAVKDAKTLFCMFDDIVKWVGASNVVHLVTDNAANYKAAGRLLADKYTNIYWSPCAAHCLNLLLGDIGKMAHVTDLAKRASLVTKFIYNHAYVLALLRKRDGWTEIIRPGATRFATTFIALKSLLVHKHHLQAFVTSKTFVESKYYKDRNAKAVVDVILDRKFWNDCGIIVQIVAPLIRLLRIADSDERPALGYIYDGMYRAKRTIKAIFMHKKVLYKPYMRLIKARWDRNLSQSLHAAAYYLNPAFTYDNDNASRRMEISKGWLDVVERSVPSKRTEFLEESNLFRDRQKDFGREICLQASKTMQPDQWWRTFGYDAPNVQKLAIRILSQTASSSGCERNWSVFERIHTKKRNRLEHQRLNDLVFVHYNSRLKNRVQYKKRSYDPVDYESIEKTEFWIAEEEIEEPPFIHIEELEEELLYDDESLPRNQDLTNEDVQDNVIENAQNFESFEQLTVGVEDDNWMRNLEA